MSGFGECVPYARYGETMESVEEQLALVSDNVRDGMTRLELQQIMPPGTARNGLDCAMWDIEAKLSGTSVWQLAGLSKPAPIVSCYTLSLETPEKMCVAAARHAHLPVLKIKLGGDGDIERLEAVRDGAPQSTLLVDANEGWNREDYQTLAPLMTTLGVAMVEQPMPVGNDAALTELQRTLPVCADESCHDRNSLPDLKGKYDFINIKLDKTGGLTEALALKQAAIDSGFRIMVGCMVSSSLAMAPAMLVAQGAEFVDLDGPLLLGEDRSSPIEFDGATMMPASAALWG